MPYNEPLEINDGQASPVSHSFAVSRVLENLIVRHDRSSGIMVGYPEITFGNRLPTKGNTNYKATMKIKVPVLEQVATAASGFTPGPTLAYSLNANVDVIIPERATAAEKADLLAYLVNTVQTIDWEELVLNSDLYYVEPPIA